MQKERKIGLICRDTQSHSGAGKNVGVGVGEAPPIGFREIEKFLIKPALHDGISERVPTGQLCCQYGA